MRILSPRSLIGLVCLSLLLISCKQDDFHKVYPVKGKVLVDGQPAFECLVYLHRQFDDTHPRRVTPFGLTDEKGEFQITSYITNDGAPPGDYIVTIEWRERSGILLNNFEGIDRLDGAYNTVDKTKSKTEFNVKVGTAPLELPPFNLTQTPEAKRKYEQWKKQKEKKAGLGASQ